MKIIKAIMTDAPTSSVFIEDSISWYNDSNNQKHKTLIDFNLLYELYKNPFVYGGIQLTLLTLANSLMLGKVKKNIIIGQILEVTAMLFAFLDYIIIDEYPISYAFILPKEPKISPLEFLARPLLLLIYTLLSILYYVLEKEKIYTKIVYFILRIIAISIVLIPLFI